MLMLSALRKATIRKRQIDRVNLLIAVKELMRDFHVFADHGFEQAVLQSVEAIEGKEN